MSLHPPDGFRGVFRSDELARSLYSTGAGIARAIPLAVAVPRDCVDLQLLLKWASDAHIPVIPRGSGSGMAAGAVGEHVMLDVSRFTELGEVDAGNKRITAGAGVIRNAIDNAARQQGLSFPVAPSSSAFATVGGMAATNASGARTLRYGPMRNWVTGVHCVFADGEAAWIRRDSPLPVHIGTVTRLSSVLKRLSHTGAVATHRNVRKDSSGYAGIRTNSTATSTTRTSASNTTATNATATTNPDTNTANAALLDLLIGSEGTLAVFADVELALAPALPLGALLLLTFDTTEHAAECATSAFACGASACELLDRTYLDVAEATAPTGIDRNAEAVLIVEFELTDQLTLNDSLLRMTETARRCRARSIISASEASEVERIWALRHAASPTLAALPPSTRSMQFIEDSCVPPENFAAYVQGVRKALARHDTTGVVFGHAGDAHAHVNPLIDLTRSNWKDTMRGLSQDVYELTFRLGGTLSGEHGDGRVRAPMLAASWGPDAIQAFREIKAAADPLGILNPGCKIASDNDDPFAVVRYDPELAPLNAAAQLRLAEIERTRSWNSYRLAGF